MGLRVQPVSVDNTTCVPGYTTVSVDTQQVFVVTLDVAVGTQLKQLCLWIYSMCLWIHMLLLYLNLLQYQIL